MRFVATIISNSIKITQSVRKYSHNEVVPNGNLEFTFNVENNNNLFLMIYRRGLIGKLFSSYSFTGNKNFDSRFKINSSDKQLALSIFSNNNIQNFFLNEVPIVFNISTQNQKTIIKLKWVEKKIYNENELKQKYKLFDLILNQIKKYWVGGNASN